MLRNYFLVAIRNIARHKFYSGITIAGLAVGLACVVFIVLFVSDELSYDKWLPGTKSLYQLELTFALPSRPSQNFATVPFAMPAAMRDEIPEVTAFTRLHPEDMSVIVGDRQFDEDVQVVDPNFLNVIRLPFVSGDRAHALSQPGSVVLTETMASKYFGNANPIGRILNLNRGNCALTDEVCRAATIPLTVTGVLEDLPHNTQLKATVLLPNTSMADQSSQEAKQDWSSNNDYGYVVLAPGAKPQTVLEKLKPILDRELATKLSQAKLHVRGSQVLLVHMTPFTDVHLSSAQFSLNLTPPGSWTTVYGVIVIGVLIMSVACFNFTNLATARAMLRAREIALRRSIGAQRRQIVIQFLEEAVVIALIALVVALSMVEILLPSFDGFLQRPIILNYVVDWQLLALILTIAVGVGLLSGAYPALVLSSFRPASALHTSNSGQSGSGRLRTMLVVMQFAVSIALGITVAVVFAQIRYARQIDLGFRHDHVVIVPSWQLTSSARDNFVQMLRGYPGVLATALSSDVAFTNNQSLGVARIPGQPDTVILNQLSISPEFPRLYDVPLVAGRMLSDSRSDDTFKGILDPANEGHNIVLNEAAAVHLGFTPQQMVGKTIIFNNSHVQVVGVLRDFKFRGAREPVKPTVYFYAKDSTGEISVRVRAAGQSATLAFIARVWHSLAPNAAPQIHFLDDSFHRLYAAEEREGTLFGIFAGIAIVIACLGLFGLAAFTAGRRTREIGIRKVYGARTGDVALLLLWHFSLPVLAANLIAWPVAGYYLHGWLQGFAYQISLTPLYFIAAAVIALIIAWTTVGIHALRVARASPVHALRYE